jgi:hypothetical protein
MTRALTPSVALAAALLASGCASDPRSKEAVLTSRTYSAPAVGTPQALARISTDAYTQLSPGDRCLNSANPAAGAAVSNFANPLGLVKLHTGAKKGVAGAAPVGLAAGELALPADVPTTVYYRASGADGTTSFSCRAWVWFVPAAGAQYQVMAMLASDRSSCNIAVTQLLAAGPQPVEVTPTCTCEG